MGVGQKSQQDPSQDPTVNVTGFLLARSVDLIPFCCKGLNNSTTTFEECLMGRRRMPGTSVFKTRNAVGQGRWKKRANGSQLQARCQDQIKDRLHSDFESSLSFQVSCDQSRLNQRSSVTIPTNSQGSHQPLYGLSCNNPQTPQPRPPNSTP